MNEFLGRILAYQFVLEIFDALIGVGICYGALKWRKGLMTTVAFYWGIIIGGTIGIALTYENLMNRPSSGDFSVLIGCLIAGGILFPILTYTVAGVNRFVLGFIVVMKLTYMVTTVAARDYGMDIATAFATPLIVGTLAGVVFMAWTQMRIGPFVIACAFLGASQLAPTLAKYTQQLLFGITGDYSYIIDPVDIIAGVFKIELTDTWTLVYMIPLMITGIIVQFRSVRNQGYPPSTPIISYETDIKEKHGKISSSYDSND